MAAFLSAVSISTCRPAEDQRVFLWLASAMPLTLPPKRQNPTMPNPILAIPIFTIPTSLLPAVRSPGATAHDGVITR
jgi:hypothetical protein